jgi:hypothetical protein
MDYRSFDGFDDPTVHNLRVLEHHAGQAPLQDAESMQSLLESVLGAHKMLPTPLRHLIGVHACLIGDRHMRMRPERLHELWEAITADLRVGLD